jgi:hypothetical protein
MRDRNLEKNIERVEAFVVLWKQLSQFLDRGFRGENFTDQEEAEFLELKSKIAQEHEVLMTVLGVAEDSMRDDKSMRLLNSVPSLQSFKDLPEGMGKKIASEWHTTFLALEALLGRLRGRKMQLAGISTFRVGLKRVMSNPLLVVLVMAAAAYGVYKFSVDWIPQIRQHWEKTP